MDRALQATFDRSQRITDSVIVPITDDRIWRENLGTLRPLDLPTGPILVIAPHPDDETLGAGALIATLSAQATRVIVVAATDGENAYDLPPAGRIDLGLIREREQRKALGLLGVQPDSVIRLRLTDSGLMGQRSELERRVMEVAEPGMTILAPWQGDFHPDHVACAHVACSVAQAKGLALISYFFWTWHRGSPETLDGLPLRRFIPTFDARAAKAQAIGQHRSQFESESGDPILNDRLIAPIYWDFEVFLSA
ncbi:PIG-L deacetylase family protein [Terriglobus roseus]|uniref:PIG-L deacetylase family protein n=1 Tax=Terriglobus roseus TaxID=392734 RepID=UPI0015604B38|nr:PIG-L family deacetylase [Terriglobus roseus]